MVVGYERDFQNKLWACRELKQKATDEAAELRAENAKLREALLSEFGLTDDDLAALLEGKDE